MENLKGSKIAVGFVRINTMADANAGAAARLALRGNAYDYAAHCALVKHLKASGAGEDLEQARQAFSSVLSMPEGKWWYSWC